jgi:signal transduction histidine kinase
MLSTVQGALRARRRQYQVRDQMEQYRRAEAALRKSEKLALAGRLAASIAHEINNPLTAVTNLHYLIARSESLPEIKRLLAIADEELARVAEIAKQTLKFHREASRSTAVEPRDVIESVLTLYRGRLHSAGIEVITDFGPHAVIAGFAGELRQLFANLVGNALDAMWGGGTLRIRVRSVQRSGAPGVIVTVADSGIGIPRDVRPQLFEPFVSTKGNTGTGLGLWVAAEIVRHHAGTIRLKSREGAGTVFTVFLPKTRPAAAPAPEPVNQSA